MSADPAVVVSDARGRERYEVRLDGELAGFVQYRLRPGLIALIHTEIADRFEGQGLAGKLIAFALNDARERGLDVLPSCPFVNAYIKQHREYVDLVPEAQRKSFDL